MSPELLNSIEKPEGVARKTNREIVVQNRFGQAILNQTEIYTGTGYESVQWVVQEYNEETDPIHTYYSDGTQTDTTWDCCGKDDETDRRGIVTDYQYNDLKQLEYTIKSGVTTSYTYDAAGRRKSTTMTGGSLTLASSTLYDTAGRTDLVTDEKGLEGERGRKGSSRLLSKGVKSAPVSKGVKSAPDSFRI